MGYTHYYPRVKELDPEKFEAFVQDFKGFYEHRPSFSDSAGGHHENEPLDLFGPMGEGEPIIQSDMISFNGDASKDLDHETFYFPQKLDEGGEGKVFQFCKTARKPYDFLVCAALMFAKYHFGDDIEVRSDGDYREWKPVLEELWSQGFTHIECPIAKEEEVE